MNPRERFQAIMRYQDVDRLPFWDLEGITEQAIRQWCIEGMPIGVDVNEYVGYDSKTEVPLATTPIPSFVSRTVASDDEWVTYIDPYGFTVKRSRQQAVPPTVYYYIGGSMDTMADWPSVRARYDPTDPKRFPDSWSKELLEHYRTSSGPVGLRLHWGPGRGIKNGYMFGLEKFLIMMAEEPDALQPIFEFSAHFMIELARPLMEQVPVDYLILMEDGMAYKNSSLISPALFRRLWQPHMRKVTDFFRSNGVDFICYYTSGDLEPLIPVLLETGFNLFAPLEVAADMNAIDLRAKYGRDALLMGNIGRQALMDGPQAIDEAFEGLLSLIESGGFIPVVDDMILPDISFANFMHYAGWIKGFRF
jgi:uroporphyrinogen decarboxylase